MCLQGVTTVIEVQHPLNVLSKSDNGEMNNAHDDV